ncbi:DUF624 domain-containing protein [Glycomyces albidus]|jgi:hypothetical protein|uniref:DUF624 domain-containing protein n=1 Tax=Glycomyces albidus TaxID=2656774 RepID=A0A6L5GBK2_9ACTN|nr:DUF624 domain-containing protein [Glycomyces albidus]MQM27054.1 DUF624 domain-containing protein [Glycomyces albidus]
MAGRIYGSQASPRPQRRQAFGEGFALFAECLLTGVWFALAALPVVTVPAALAAAARHLRAHTEGDSTSWVSFWSDFRAAWRGGRRVGLAVVGAGVVLALNLAVLAQEGVPGRSGFALATFVVAGLALTVLLRAAADWSPGERWRDLFASAVDAARTDPGGTGILLGGVAVLAATTWALWVLAVPMAGCLVGAAVAVRRRRLDRSGEDAGE